MAKSKPKTKVGKILNVIANIILYTFLACLVLLLVVLISARVNKTVPMVFGRSILKIVSGSMEDTIPTGTYILIDDTSFDKIEVGDIVTFYMVSGELKGSPNTHRVVEVNVENGVRYFRTKGDNAQTNPIPDADPVYESQYIGKYVMSLTVIGAVADFFAKPIVFFLLIMIPATFLIVSEIVRIIKGGKLVKKKAALSEDEIKKRAVEEYLKAHSAAALTEAEAKAPENEETPPPSDRSEPKEADDKESEV